MDARQAESIRNMQLYLRWREAPEPELPNRIGLSVRNTKRGVVREKEIRPRLDIEAAKGHQE